MSTLSLRIPNSIHNKVREVSQKEHVSVNQFISSALSEKLSAYMTEEYITQRAKKASRKKFIEALKQIPHTEPEEYDKL